MEDMETINTIQLGSPSIPHLDQVKSLDCNQNEGTESRLKNIKEMK